MKKAIVAIFAGVLFSTAIAPAFAACNEEIVTLTTALESADVSAEDRAEVTDLLATASDQASSGEEDACLASVDAAKEILGM